MNDVKRVLFVSYTFPPHGGPGVYRSAKFVKYLPQCGWLPIVLTSASDAGMTVDESFISDIPSTTMVRRVEAYSAGRLVRVAKRVRLDLPVRVFNVLCALPDPARHWSWRARQTAREMIEKYAPSVVYTTSCPYSDHLLGLWLKKTFGLPWLADFQDPWSTNLVTPYPPGYRFYNRRLERAVVRAADKVICVSQPWLDELRQTGGESPSRKYRVIENGFDRGDLWKLPPKDSHGVFRLLHAGSFYPNRTPENFVAAVRSLLMDGSLDKGSVEFMFVGENAAHYIPKQPPFVVKDYVPHDRMPGLMMHADALLLLLATSAANKGNFSGKIYECISSGRPILGIVPKGGVAEELIARTKSGMTCEGSVATIRQTLLEMWRRWQRKETFEHDWTEIERYDRRILTKQLAAELSELAAGGSDQ